MGRGLEDYANLPHAPPGEILLEVVGLVRREDFHDISFTLRRGEVVGMAGMVGSGRTEVARCIAGADLLDAGTIIVKGKTQNFRGPPDSVMAGIAFLTEDRKHQGLALQMSLAKNITLPSPPTRFGFIDRNEQGSKARSMLAKASSKVPPERIAGKLSGGNQQKVVLAKWLLTKSEIFIFDEPTRGIDVGAKAEIYALMRELADKGAAILMISSEMPELLRMSDRIVVMREGRTVGEVGRAEANEERIVARRGRVRETGKSRRHHRTARSAKSRRRLQFQASRERMAANRNFGRPVDHRLMLYSDRSGVLQRLQPDQHLFASGGHSHPRDGADYRHHHGGH